MLERLSENMEVTYVIIRSDALFTCSARHGALVRNTAHTGPSSNKWPTIGLPGLGLPWTDYITQHGSNEVNRTICQ